MLSTSSCSKTIIRENLKRYWLIPVLTLLAYFLAGMLPMLLNYNSFAGIVRYAESIMRGSSLVINFFISCSAVITSAAVFGYMHEPVSANSVHAMPVKRSGLFNSAVISGWIMMIAPLVVFAFMTLLMRGATTPPGWTNGEYNVSRVPAESVFTLAHVLGFIFTAAVSATISLAVSSLAAVLAGRTVIHILLAGFLMVLPAGLVGLLDLVCRYFLFGFPGLDTDYSMLSVIAALVKKEDYKISWGIMLYYIVISLIILAAASLIYRRVKIERIGSACTFPVVADVLCVLLTLICSVSFSMMLDSATSGSGIFNTSPARFIVIELISSIVFYIVMRMIADSTFAVFNARSAKHFGVYLVILAVFCAFTAADVTGYTKRVPAAGEIASVHIETTVPDSIFGTIKADLDDKKSIEAMRDLQGAVISDRHVDSNDLNTDYMKMTWSLGNGRKISRNYTLNRGKGFKRTEEGVKKLYDAPGFKKFMHIQKEGILKHAESIDMEAYSITGNDEFIRIRKADWEGLLQAMDEDISSRTYEEMYSIQERFPEEDYGEEDYEAEEGWVCINVTAAQDGQVPDVYDYEREYFMAQRTDTKTFRYLKDKGYLP